jgi:hypothetical protein
VFKPLDFGSYSVYRPANHVWWGIYLGGTAGKCWEDEKSVSLEQYINIKGRERVIYDVKICDSGTGFDKLLCW